MGCNKILTGCGSLEMFGSGVGTCQRVMAFRGSLASGKHVADHGKGHLRGEKTDSSLPFSQRLGWVRILSRGVRSADAAARHRQLQTMRVKTHQDTKTFSAYEDVHVKDGRGGELERLTDQSE